MVHSHSQIFYVDAEIWTQVVVIAQQTHLPTEHLSSLSHYFFNVELFELFIHPRQRNSLEYVVWSPVLPIFGYLFTSSGGSQSKSY